jgi:SepF-like predicted cell division protein (DUF552 family)
MEEVWEMLPASKERSILFRVISTEGVVRDFFLGAHAPELSQAAINITHELWIEATHEVALDGLQHGDIVTVAVQRLEQDMESEERHEVLEQLKTILETRKPLT